MNRLKNLRQIKDIKQIELCNILGISQGNLSNWENGNYEPDNASLIKLAKYFNVTIDYLLGHSDNPLPNKQLPNTKYHLDLYNKALAEKGHGPVEHIFDTTTEDLIGMESLTPIPSELQNASFAFSGGLEKDLTSNEIEEMKKFREFILSKRNEKKPE